MTEKDIQFLLYKKHNYRSVYPNVHMDKGNGSEVDLLHLTKSGRAIFYEIKLSKQDFLADMKKPRHQDFTLRNVSIKPKHFWYVIHGFEIDVEQIPEYAGCVKVVDKYYNRFEVIKNAPLLWKDPISLEDVIFIINKTSYRYINIFFKDYFKRI